MVAYSEEILLSHIDEIFRRHSGFTISIGPQKRTSDQRQASDLVRDAIQGNFKATFSPSKKASRRQNIPSTTVPVVYESSRFDRDGQQTYLFLSMRVNTGRPFIFKVPQSNLVPSQDPNPGLEDSLELQIASDLSTYVDEYISRYTFEQLNGATLTIDGKLTTDRTLNT